MSRKTAKRSKGFVPVSGPDARILILGSLPGVRSLQQAEYYAHPRNVFWRVMSAISGASGSYEERCAGLIRHGIALWDVLKEAERPGSLDSNISVKDAETNDLYRFISEHEALRLIAFNGQRAAALFRAAADPVPTNRSIELQTLPSTSPAYAAMGYEDKLARWSAVLGPEIARPSADERCKID